MSWVPSVKKSLVSELYFFIFYIKLVYIIGNRMVDYYAYNAKLNCHYIISLSPNSHDLQMITCSCKAYFNYKHRTDPQIKVWDLQQSSKFD